MKYKRYRKKMAKYAYLRIIYFLLQLTLYFVVASTLCFSFIVSDFSVLLVINCLMQVW